MVKGPILFILLTHLLNRVKYLRACVPNTYFTLNGRLCFCDYQGRWAEANCKVITRNQTCQSGQIIWQGCNQCVCQENNQLLCTNAFCRIDVRKTTPTGPRLSYYDLKCIPFQSYYVNCSLCVCPASGQSTDAQCTMDSSCTLNSRKTDIYTISKINQCLPNVIYLFPCIQCLCSQNGRFIIDKCQEKCQLQNIQRCKPGNLYRRGCDICRCPDSGIPVENMCIKSDCNSNSLYFKSLRSSRNRCVPQTFTEPRCLFCDCNSEGHVNRRSCLELDCSKTSNFNYYSQSDICSPGELVAICSECFCLNNGNINETYCTSTCTYQNKMNILHKVFNHSAIDLHIIDKSKIKNIRSNDPCEPNTLYLNDGRYCLCSHSGYTKFEYCTSIIKHSSAQNKPIGDGKRIKMDFNINCEPNTLVDFDCNTCYCSKKGKIDPKWCTYDDCEAKRLVQESHQYHSSPNEGDDSHGFCTPGSISKVKCNFCICPESGILEGRACTKNNCFNYEEATNNKFTCEPLAYYEVDCNVCYCPHDGLKNVAKCTKNRCEKSFLRSNTCIAGHLFSDKCNVCVCPPNGDKEDRVCTNHTCDIPHWNAFELSQSLSENKIEDDLKRSLDLCFPGEEFAMGCDLCVCPEQGLKTYATCEPLLCDDKYEDRNGNVSLDNTDNSNNGTNASVDSSSKRPANERRPRVRRDIYDKCFTYNISDSAEIKDCTPGTTYIIRCRQCICPYVGNINNFCRPLPKNMYCEQAYPGFNYLSMKRRNANNTGGQTKSKSDKGPLSIIVKHLNHTVYKCNGGGNVADECFICECEDGNFIYEHCYKNDAKYCIDATPTFLKNKIH